MTSPHPSDPHSAQDRSSTSSSSTPHAPYSSSRRGLTPISTSTGSTTHKTLTSTSHSPRNPWSPAPNAATAGPSSILSRNPTRSSSISTSASPFSPPQPSSNNPPPGFSTRSRTATSGSAASVASSGAPSVNPRLSRASPSQSHGSPPATSSGPDPSSGSFSSIVIAQITVLLSSLKEKDKDKWESQVDQLRKLVDAHGMDVFAKYFRRLIASNTAQIWQNSRNFENGTYRVLEGEVMKIYTDPYQAAKIVEAIEHGEKDGDVFRDFNLSGFMDHFKMKTLGKIALASAFRKSNKTDLRSKADAILHNNLTPFVTTLTAFTSGDPTTDPSPQMLASIIARLAQHPPRSWSADMLTNLEEAVQRRYLEVGRPVPLEVSSVMWLFEALEPSNTLVRALQKAGTRATESVGACKEFWEGVELQNISYEQVAKSIIFMALVNSVEESNYNTSNFVSALKEHRGGHRLDWLDVLPAFDKPRVKVTKQQFKTIYNTLLPLTEFYGNLDIQLLWGGQHWRNQDTQLTFVSAFLSCSQDELDASKIPRLRKAFSIEDFEDASPEVQAYAAEAVRHPLCSLDATEALFQMVFRSSETYSQAQSLGVVENVINPKMDIFVAAVSAVQKPWGALQEQAIKQLLETLLLNQFGGNDFVFHILWKRDSNWMSNRLKQFWQQNPRQLERVLEHAQAHGWLEHLINVKDDLSLELASIAHGRRLFDLESWLEDLSQILPTPKVVGIFNAWLKGKAEHEVLVHREQVEPIGPSLQVRTVHAVLKFLGEKSLPEDQLITLQRECIQAYPRLINYGEGFDDIIDANNQAGNELPAEADAKMQEHYKHMYNSDSQVRDVVESLHKYKRSEDPGDQDLFACMIYGLFDEYNCFPEYPMEALAITAVLFGSIINFNLLSKIALKAALSMVLESVRDHNPGDSMYRFGLQALLHFQDRLSEWKMFSERLMAVPGLQGSEIQPVIERVVRENVEITNGDNQDGDRAESTIDDIFANETRIPEFSCLAVDSPQRADYDEPEEQVKENVLFTLNNISDRNMATKLPELREGLQPQHNQWLANYLVDQRVKSQPNFQKLYMDVLDHFADKQLWAEVLRETFLCSFRLLNAETTANSANERTSLRNMADWLGSITLARDKPIKHRNISFKDLLIEAHDTQRLPLAVPFTCRVLAKTANSRVFKPPCAWTVEIVEVLVELHRHAEIKTQHKFEIEKLLGDLGIDEKTIEPSTAIRDRPSPEEVSLLQVGPAMPDGLDPQMAYPRGPTERYSPATIVPELSDVGSLLKHNYNVPHLSQNVQNRLRSILVRAVERAINEIIGPVVDRSVTIASISASQLVIKDFATESDSARFSTAAQNLVRNLAGSLALVTCKEPLRTGISANIRTLITTEIGDQVLNEGAILMFVNDNLEAVCKLVEKAAENVSNNEIDYYISNAAESRKAGSYNEPQISRWAYHIPDPFKPSHGGLNREQVDIYEGFGNALKGNINHNMIATQDAARVVHETLGEQLSSLPGLPDPATAREMLQRVNQTATHSLPSEMGHGPHMVNGHTDQRTAIQRAQHASMEIIKTVLEAADEHPNQDLQNDASIHQAFRRLQGLIFSSGQASHQDQIAVIGAERLAQAVFQEPFSAQAIDVVARAIRAICEVSDVTMREVCTWLRASEERLMNATTTSAFLKTELIEFDFIDKFIANNLEQARTDALQMFGKLVDIMLFNEPTAAFRADFINSLTALGKWVAEKPDDNEAREILARLQDTQQLPQSPSLPAAAAESAQMQYIFEEWVRLQFGDPSPNVVVAFMQHLHLQKVVSSSDSLSTLMKAAIADALTTFELEWSKHPNGNYGRAYMKADALSKLIVTIATFQGHVNGEPRTARVGVFKTLAACTVLILAERSRMRPEGSLQKFTFRILSGILCELSASVRINAVEHLDMVLVMGRCFSLLAPQAFPGLAFAWLSLLSHRLFMPVLLRSSNEAAWDLCLDLLCRHFEFLGEFADAYEMGRLIKDLHRGTLELLLLLHHDFPEFLAENHYQLLAACAWNSVQLRSLIISATPPTSPEHHDPFSGGFPLERLLEDGRPPVVRGRYEQHLLDAGIKSAIDLFFLSPSGQEASVVDAIATAAKTPKKLAKQAGMSADYIDESLLSAVLLYTVTHAEKSSQSNVAHFSASAPEGRLIEALLEQGDDQLRYYVIGSMCNQVRWPNSHTYYFSYAMFHIFRGRSSDDMTLNMQMQAARVMLERLVAHRPHPWGLMVMCEELLKNRIYGFWELPFIKASSDIERMFNSLSGQMSFSQRSAS